MKNAELVKSPETSSFLKLFVTPPSTVNGITQINMTQLDPQKSLQRLGSIYSEKTDFHRMFNSS